MSRPNGIPTSSTFNHSSFEYQPYRPEPRAKFAKIRTFELQGAILELLEDEKILITLDEPAKKVLLEQGYNFWRVSYDNYPEGDNYIEAKISQALMEHYATVGFKHLFGKRTIFIRVQPYNFIDVVSQKRLKGIILHVMNIDKPRFQHHSTRNFY